MINKLDINRKKNEDFTYKYIIIYKNYHAAEIYTV